MEQRPVQAMDDDDSALALLIRLCFRNVIEFLARNTAGPVGASNLVSSRVFLRPR